MLASDRDHVSYGYIVV